MFDIRGPVYTAEDIYHTLRNEILMLELVPGSAISETETAQRFNLSRTPVRAAIAKLRGENLVQVVPQKGTYVTLLDFDYITQLIYMREKVEHHVLEDAIALVTPTFLAGMRENLARQKKLLQGKVSQAAFYNLDSKLHRMCYTLAGKDKLWNRLDEIDNQYIRYRVLYYSVSKSFQILYQEHMELYHILAEAKHAEVELFCSRHLGGYAADVNNYVRANYKAYFLSDSVG